MTDSNRTAWNSEKKVWEPITVEEFGAAIELRGRAISTTAPSNGDAYVWSASQAKWVPSAAIEAAQSGTIVVKTGSSIRYKELV